MSDRDLLANVSEQELFWMGQTSLKNLNELATILKKVDTDTFSQYVNESKNDFYNWVRDVYQQKEFAAELVDCNTKESVLACVQKWINKAERSKRERIVLETVVKTKVKELMNEDNFKPAVLLDPLSLERTKSSPKPKVQLPPMNIPFVNPLKESKGNAHPKNIKTAAPVPKLWELKPMKKVEKKIEVKRPEKQVKLTEVKPLLQNKVEDTPRVAELPRVLIKSRKVNASPLEGIVSKLKEVYKVEM